MLDLDAIAPDKIRPLTRAEYDELVALGRFEDERVELLRGMIVTMTPQKAPHAYAVQQLNEHLVPRLQGRAHVRIQLPLALSDSEPEPDLALAPLNDYSKEHPTQAWLVVEVADSTLKKDRRIKAKLYAEHGVVEYWIVNLVESVVEVHSAIREGVYTSVRNVGRTESIQLIRFPDVTLPVREFLP
jgi:Uma2 family endonuclease